MPIIPCHECDFPTSSSATSCPRCGCSFVRSRYIGPVLTAAFLLAGFGCVMKAFDSNALHAAAWAGLGCFCGIVARIFQADWYRKVPERFTKER